MTALALAVRRWVAAGASLPLETISIEFADLPGEQLAIVDRPRAALTASTAADSSSTHPGLPAPATWQLVLAGLAIVVLRRRRVV